MLEAQLSVKGTFEEIAAFIERNSIAMNMPALISSTAASMINGNVGGDHGTDDGDNTPPNPNAPQFDTAGISWDERIHSKTKALTNDGTWRKKRGVTAADITAVEAELKQRAAAAAGMYMQPGGGAPQMQNPGMPPVHAQFNPNMPGGYQQPGQPQYQQPYTPYPPQPAQFNPNMMPGPQYQQPGQPQMPPQSQPGQLLIPQTFDAFMSHLSNKMVQLNGTATPLDANYLATVCQRLSAHFQRPINSITDVGNDPNVIAVAVSFINSDGRWL